MAQNAEVDGLRAELDAAKEAYITLQSHADKHAAALNARIAELEAARRWVPVGERLPEDEGYFQVIVEGNYIADCHCFYVKTPFSGAGRHFDAGWYPIGTNSKINNVTHWQPLPAAPEAANES